MFCHAKERFQMVLVQNNNDFEKNGFRGIGGFGPKFQYLSIFTFQCHYVFLTKTVQSIPLHYKTYNYGTNRIHCNYLYKLY